MESPTLIAVGELLVEFVSHRTGCELRHLSEYSGPYPSGAPAICIDQAARLGASAHIFGSVGDDNFGHAVLQRLHDNGVDTTSVRRCPDLTTGVAFVSYFEDGSRTFIFHLNNTAADALDSEAVTLPAGPLILHISGSSLGNSRLRAVIEATADEVLSRGGHISCDPNARPELMSDPAISSVLTRLIQQSRFLFPSASDLEFLYPEMSRHESITHLLSTGVECLALTCGDQGSIIYRQNEEPLQLNGHTVNELDPTGAGDCYCGTFLALASQGHPFDVCGTYANAAGAIAVTRRGPMEGNSSLDTIESFIKDNPVKPGNS